MEFNWHKAAKPLQGDSWLFTTRFPEIHGTHLIKHARMKVLSRPWSHPVVLNMGPLDLESSVLTTTPLLKYFSNILRHQLMYLTTEALSIVFGEF